MAVVSEQGLTQAEYPAKQLSLGAFESASRHTMSLLLPLQSQHPVEDKRASELRKARPDRASLGRAIARRVGAAWYGYYPSIR